MKTSTAKNHLLYFKSRVDSIWSIAKSSQLPHAWIMQEMHDQIRSHPAWIRCPYWVRVEVEALSAFYLQRIYQRDVAFLYAGSKEPRPYEYLSEADKEKVRDDELRGRHYWLVEGISRKRNGVVVRTFYPTNKHFS
jgi:hypothetical protein